MVAYLKSFNFLSVLLRLILAMLSGTLIGYGRSKFNHTAGLRTFILISIGAALSVLISLYEIEMQNTLWAIRVAEIGQKYDVSRFGAQVISGVGFLSAGSIIAIEHNQVQGLTTATGLFATVCMGLAAGAGFYECVIISLLLIVFVLNTMSPIEYFIKRKMHNIDIYVIFDNLESIQTITDRIKDRKAEIFDIDIERSKKEGNLYPSAMFSLKLSREKASHSDMLSALAELDCVYSVQEIIN